MSSRPIRSARERGHQLAISPNRLRSVIAYVEAHLGEKITLEDLARVACISRFHFCRAFHRAVGVSPYRYVTEERIRRAKRMLQFSDAALETIAREVGFNSRRQFAAQFHRLAGISPGHFRRLPFHAAAREPEQVVAHFPARMPPRFDTQR